jgi:putative transposase
VFLSAGKWVVSIQTEKEVPDPVPESATAVGIDMSVACFVTFADGAFYEPLDSFKKHKQGLVRYQRAMSWKQKFKQ